MADDLSQKLNELTTKLDSLTRSMSEIQTVLHDVLTVDKMNNQVTVQSANYLCKAVGEMLGTSRYLQISANVKNGVTLNLPEDAQRFNELIALLWPKSVPGFPKIRLGNRGDGGYVLLQDLDNISTAYSLGICDNVSFDVDLARHAQNLQTIFQFDDSVDKPPVDNPKFRFERKRINSISDLGALADNSLLKIDIEGSEWNFFMSCSDEDLGKFRQIGCEFHEFNTFRSEGWYERTRAVLEKIYRTHQPIHIHANNIAHPVWTGERFFPSVLEVTYARRTDYTFVPSTETFPGQYDTPSSIYFPDVKLDPTGIKTSLGDTSFAQPLPSGRFQL